MDGPAITEYASIGWDLGYKGTLVTSKLLVYLCYKSYDLALLNSESGRGSWSGSGSIRRLSLGGGCLGLALALRGRGHRHGLWHRYLLLR